MSDDKPNEELPELPQHRRDEIAREAARASHNHGARLAIILMALATLIAVIGLVVVLWLDRTTAEDERDAVAGQAKTVSDEGDDVTDRVLPACAAGEITDAKTCREARELAGEIDATEDELQDPELQDVELQDPELQEPERQNPERDDPDPDDPEQQNPEDQDAENDDADPDDPEVDDPENQDSEFDDPEQQEPETQDPEEQDPEQQDPEINDPDPDDPDPNDEPRSPYPFTFDFEWMGMTWTCVIDGPDDNQCTPSEE
jgi:FtsZ-interacting cell division protein ZipA